ncbi:MAG: sulfur oxidation c-type cytochrome SoxX [Burkholderiaceae bacterium]
MNARRATWACGGLIGLTFCAAVRAQAPEGLATYQVVGDAIPRALTTTPGDAARGRAIVTNKQLGLCLLCHTGPFADEPFQGNLAPDLAGVGTRLTEGQLRLRLVDGRRTHPATIMPAYHRTEGLVRVGPTWQGKPLLAAQQIEDVVAFLLTLRAAR